MKINRPEKIFLKLQNISMSNSNKFFSSLSLDYDYHSPKALTIHYVQKKYWKICAWLTSGCLMHNDIKFKLKGGNRFKKGFLKWFSWFFYNKGMNIIYLYFVNILYIYLRRNCEIFEFFFFRNMEDIGCCPSNVTNGTFVHSGSHRFYLKSIRFKI